MKFILMMNHPGKVPYQITNWAPSEIKAHRLHERLCVAARAAW
jgi:hypothetical protein